ncbi:MULTISPECIES: Orn/Lys/Arg decarboxylase N-terminal domain-containing protein [unclassified Rhizobium]|uniref:Orn/Lys/Arg family decarboxylase n=1 Tax=unclassified Rhizobium TaxID=2613769 RepID=UPI000715C0A3|nr:MULTISPECIES: Orn/Lys/Arg decarboxylase N-terminal domain-containing protein [unclassified Rhizobium]KQS96434.1 arginine decarboxylase [Rhizobium sp. Leaf386]KQT06273.1 arginine decarboxylase [Rhizobium sp. Leaf391]KQU09492.1 arginine decarboxylase [Rhizobium sp. Leaf453]
MKNEEKKRLGMTALVADDEIGQDSAAGRAVASLIAELERRDISVVTATTSDDAISVIRSDPSLQCILLDWDLGVSGHDPSIAVVEALRARNAKVPVFLLADRSVASTVPADIMSKVDDFVWLLEDTTDFVGGRILAAIQRYRSTVLPPMFGALARFSQVYEYSWHTPGHTGGTAFLKSTAGRAFFEYFGEPLFRSDLSISVGQLGSLLDHSGPIGASEKYAARVFGSHRTYHVTNGSSTSNRVILMASVSRDQIALCDRNCHKSAEHAMTMSGAIPTYLLPTRNHYGIIGPIPPERLTAVAIRKLIDANPLADGIEDREPKHAIITNSTYDGLCYNVTRVEELLGASVDRLHFDEAWYGYARFNPMYRERHAMHGDAKDHGPDKPTVFATHSTHKLLAALSQASFIHVRDGKKAIPHSVFNETFMMHASTSPNYAIIASNDVSAAMMDGPGGQALTSEAIEEAVSFRQMIARLNNDFADRSEWFFDCWQPETVIDPKTGRKQPFHEASFESLTTSPLCWVLKPGAAWHGFGEIEDGYCMLDPIKVSIVTPGVAPGGGLMPVGIPAGIVTAYLNHRGIVAEKTTDFTILFLFSIGITKGKWGSLVSALCDFKRDYDANVPLEVALPKLMADYGDRYANMGLKDLADTMFSAMDQFKTTEMMAAGFSTLPVPDMSPVRAYEVLVRGDVEKVTLDELAGRTVATGVVPYPPGIPLMMPGENAGPADGPLLGYLKALEAYDSRFPGFTHDTHGVEVEDGVYHVYCLKRT